ncbi:MAG: ABC transporter substrate-binding protein [Candidatus Bathyarchaeota archaeon]|nr:ABC transporter substrate-binding protein [Candidatus Termiticorpusculum sp.]
MGPKIKTVIALALIVIIASVSFYAVYNEFYKQSSTNLPSSSNPSTNNPSSSTDDSSNSSSSSDTRNKSSSSSSSSSDSKTVTITDGAGVKITLPDTPKRIIVMEDSLAEILFLLGAKDSIIARTDTVVTPELQTLPSIASMAFMASAESIFVMEPDLIVASSQFGYTSNPAYSDLDTYNIVTKAGIPVFLESSADSQPINPSKMSSQEIYNANTKIDDICYTVKQLSALVGNEDRANEYITWVQSYNKQIKDKLNNLPRDKQDLAFLDWYISGEYRTYVDLSICQGGGINIAENVTLYNPALNPEFIVAQNPAVIIVMISSNSHSSQDFINARNAVLNNQQFKDIDAVKNGRVYVCDFNARNGARSVIGYLAFAKWLQPDLFADVDVGAVNRYLCEHFLGTPTTHTYYY